MSDQPPHALSFAGQKRQRDDREEVESLRAELERARKELAAMTELREQAEVDTERKVDTEIRGVLERYRHALERIVARVEAAKTDAWDVDDYLSVIEDVEQIARDALAGDQ